MSPEGIHVADPTELGDCPDCGGTGENDIGWDCSTCGGTGQAPPERCDGCDELADECTCDDQED